jgi:hypothetical protein
LQAEVLFDRAHALKEMIDFLREAGDILGSFFERIQPLMNILEFGLDVREPEREEPGRPKPSRALILRNTYAFLLSHALNDERTRFR